MKDCGELRNENASRRWRIPRPGRICRRWTSERGESHFLAIVLAALFTLTVGTLIFTELGKGLRQKVSEICGILTGQTPEKIKGDTTPSPEK